MTVAWLVPSLSVVVLLTGCGESFTPGELAGTYVLAAVEGQPPPHLELATIECDQQIVGGLLVLQADETHSLNLSIELDCSRGGGQVSVAERSYSGTFSVDEDRLEFTSPQPGGADLVFRGRARESVVDVALPSMVFGLDPFLDVRFDEGACIDVCPAGSQ
jgi:hypothetical protein